MMIAGALALLAAEHPPLLPDLILVSTQFIPAGVTADFVTTTLGKEVRKAGK